MCASSPTSTCPKASKPITRKRAAPGRDGLPSIAWMIYGLQDVVRLRQMADESTAGEEYKRHERQKLDTLLGWCEVTDLPAPAPARLFR